MRSNDTRCSPYSDHRPPEQPTTGPGTAEQPYRWVLPHDEQAAGAAREVTRAALEDWDVNETSVDEALVVVSELVTNAVEHAQPPVVLHLAQPDPGDVVHVEVDDGGRAELPGAWVASCAPDEHGRGNIIIDALATTHGTRVHSWGCTNWADLHV
ncbi:ATP-binding protein [Kitasatospora sp. NPDC048540]|uniref:ATP-binding protein n=1 Tax=unclassified Kitasatospora TaxID=2633591 RepID=UPI0009E65F28|nr:ATP-binding protein [Kitasatospora sp. MBT63]